MLSGVSRNKEKNYIWQTKSITVCVIKNILLILHAKYVTQCVNQLNKKSEHIVSK